MTEFVTPQLRTVLKTYQNSATKSLQGPGQSLSVAAAVAAVAHHNGGGSISPINCIQQQQQQQQSTNNNIKKEILNSPEPQFNDHNDIIINNTSSLTSSSSSSQSLLSPPVILPTPLELLQPILTTSDTGRGELYETILEGKTIGCFLLGGEMRLCLPQFLNNVLTDFKLDQINRIFDDLRIFCSQCTPEQLMEFKSAKILPEDVKASGLITRTDAERICSALLHRSERRYNLDDLPKGAITFKIYHRCFGKCEGICTPDLYTITKPACIMCLECKGMFSPQKFVGHVHRQQENRTCHWGFDSRNWHDYLHVALDIENRDKYTKMLDELWDLEQQQEMQMLNAEATLKRKAEIFDDILLPPMPSCKRESIDVPTLKKQKIIDEAYLRECQRYQQAFYFAQQCAQREQLSAFRPWATSKQILHLPPYAAAAAAYNQVAAAKLPYLNHEPPILQNPERVVRNTESERFERTFQPNVSLVPIKSISKEREKERDRERERNNGRNELRNNNNNNNSNNRIGNGGGDYNGVAVDRERSNSCSNNDSTNNSNLHSNAVIKKLSESTPTLPSPTDIVLHHIKQERPNSPDPIAQSPEDMCLAIQSPPPPTLTPQQQQQQINHNNLSNTTSNNNHLHHNSIRHHTSHQRHHQHQNNNNNNNSLQQQHPHQSHNQCEIINIQTTSSMLPSPVSPEEFSGSNEITSSTSPVPYQNNNNDCGTPTSPTLDSPIPNDIQHQQNLNKIHQQLQQQHAHILKSIKQEKITNLSTITNGGDNIDECKNNIGNNVGPSTTANYLPNRIHISKNLINNPNVIRSPTPPSLREQYNLKARTIHHHHQQQLLQQQQQQQQQLQHQSPSQSTSATSSSNGILGFASGSTAIDHDVSETSCSGGVVVKNFTNGRHHHHQQLQQQQQQLQQIQYNNNNHNHHPHHVNHNSNQGVISGINSEFELSTDTDDDSLNGEPDSSNTIIPLELAAEALKDTRPTDRDKILQIIQKFYKILCNENAQLRNELKQRDEKIIDLQREIQHLQRQQQQFYQQQQHKSGVIAKIENHTKEILDGCTNGGVIAIINDKLTLPITPTQAITPSTTTTIVASYQKPETERIKMPLKKSLRRSPEETVVVLHQIQNQQRDDIISDIKTIDNIVASSSLASPSNSSSSSTSSSSSLSSSSVLPNTNNNNISNLSNSNTTNGKIQISSSPVEFDLKNNNNSNSD